MVGDATVAGVNGECGDARTSCCGGRDGKCRARPGVAVVYSERTEDPSDGETDFVLPEDDRLRGAITDVGLCLQQRE
jgi:hypothetical protein